MVNFPETRISLILRLGQSTDVEAWQEFAEIYAPTLHRLAVRKGLQPADAEDVTQEILFGVARAIERFEPDQQRARFRTWLGRIARNLIADFCSGRAKRPLSQTISDSWLQAVENRQLILEPSGDDAIFLEEHRRAVFRYAAQRVRRRVAADTWRAFEATCILQTPAVEVAQELGVGVGNVYVYRCRVLKMLRGEVQALQATYEVAADWTSGGSQALEERPL